jgi:hypothetical protein
MHLPCASPLLKTKGQTGTRNMAEASPPRRGSFMNGAGDSQPRARDVASLIMKAAIVVVAALLLTGAAAGPHKVVRNSAVLEFTYRWPSEAAAIPRLDAMFYKQAKADLAKAQAVALEDRNLARRDKREFHPHYYSMVWHTVGQTPRLLSLEAAFEGFTGGAHPNHGNEALLWDRRLNRKIEASALFLKSSAFPALTRRAYCRALDAERSKRKARSSTCPSSTPAPSTASSRSPLLTRTGTAASTRSTSSRRPTSPAHTRRGNMRSPCL